ncbi:MAG: type IX secretion system membrane protein PorP/SprF [Bacteroidota bacterium]
MIKKLLLLTVASLLYLHVSAQQDPMFTQYMFNGLVLNPAYAGVHEAISLSAGTRIQWTGTGSEKPFTNTFAIHAPLQGRLAMGASFTDDQIGRTNRDRLNLNLAYRIPMGLGKLAFGISGGMMVYNLDAFSASEIGDPNDPLNTSFRTTKPEIGAGIMYYTDIFFLGVSTNNLINNELQDNDASMPFFRSKQHFFAYAGYVFNINEIVKLKPNALLKYVDGAPVQLDLNANALFYDRFGVGLSYRSLDAFSIIAELQFPQTFFSVGYSYDLVHTDLFNQQFGTHELTLNYRFGIKKSVLLTPRYF